MIRSKIAVVGIAAAAALGLSMTGGGDALANQGNAALSLNEAAQCSALSSRIEGQDDIIDGWRSAVNSWRSYGASSVEESNRFKSMVASLNRSIAQKNGLFEQYDRKCFDIEISRKAHKDLCTGVNNGFCRSFN